MARNNYDLLRCDTNLKLSPGLLFDKLIRTVEKNVEQISFLDLYI